MDEGGAADIDGSVFGYAVLVTIWLRCLLVVATLVEVNYRIESGSVSHYLNNLYVVGFGLANLAGWLRMRRVGHAERWLLLLLSGLDLCCVSFSSYLAGGLEGRYFPFYYVSVAMFAWLFTSPAVVVSWATLTAGAYCLVCVLSGGVDLAVMEEKALFYRVLAIYGVAVSVSMVTRFERRRRVRAVVDAEEVSRQRVELSQEMHDRTAQSAYMLGIGLDGLAVRFANGDRYVLERLEALGDLSRSMMWDLRWAIDSGDLFDGGTLGHALVDLGETFMDVTAIETVVEVSGDERALPAAMMGRLFAVAHNALTNAYRHAEADRVVVRLSFEDESVSLSVADNGLGLPENYLERGRGFGNMKSDMERLGGSLEVWSDGNGTVVSFRAPYAPV